MGRYKVKESPPEKFTLLEDGNPIAFFTRENFRTSLENLDRGSNWVASMLRIFLKTYPPPLPKYVRTNLDRMLAAGGEEGIADYLRSKGLRVVKELKWISDLELISFLEKKGYSVEGILGDVYYRTEHRNLPEKVIKDKAPLPLSNIPCETNKGSKAIVGHSEKER